MTRSGRMGTQSKGRRIIRESLKLLWKVSFLDLPGETKLGEVNKFLERKQMAEKKTVRSETAVKWCEKSCEK